MNINQLKSRATWARIAIGLIVIAMMSQGCAGNIRATIHLPDGEKAIYVGPQKAKLLLEEKGRKVEYTGLSDPWWTPFVAILGGAASNATQRDTNINVK